MQTASIRKDGGPVSATIRCGHAQPGSYQFQVWEAQSNRIAQGFPRNGNFLNQDDDTYQLLSPNERNDGCIAEAIVTVALAPQSPEYDVRLDIYQDGAHIGDDSRSGTSQEPSVTLDLFVLLVMEVA